MGIVLKKIMILALIVNKKGVINMRVLIENIIYNVIKVEKSVCAPILYITVPLLSPNKHRIYSIKYSSNYYMSEAFFNILHKGYCNTDHYSVEEISFL